MSYPPYNPGYPANPGYPNPGGMPQPQAAPGGLPYPPQPYPSGAPAAPYPSAGQPGYMAGGPGMPVPGGFPSAMPGVPAPSQPPYSQATPYPAPVNPYPAPGGYPNPSAPYPNQGGASYPDPNSHNMPGFPAAGPPQPGYPQPTPQPAATGTYPTPPVAATGSHPSAPAQPTTSAKSAKPAGSTQKQDADATHYYTCAMAPGDSGTVKPLKSNFNPEADATQIRNCLKSVSVNETIIVNILPHRSNAQRQKIRSFYKTIYGRDLLQDFRERLNGDFESVAAAMLMTPDEYDAYLIHKAISGAGTDEDTLIEVLCTRNNAQMMQLGRTYHEIYNVAIEADIKDDTSGHFKRMLISLANGARQENQGVNAQKAEEDAKKLYNAGAGRLGTDESVFNSIFVSQSFEQLRAVFQTYERLYKKDMEKVIKSEMSGDLESGMKTIVRFSMDKHMYFANLMYKAMKGLGTNEKCLIRTLVSRSEIDLEQIKKAFTLIKGEGKPLNFWIKKETSGPLRDMLVHIMGDSH